MNKKQGKVLIVCGGSYGSESKGLVACELVKNEKIDYIVRTGAINAGHTTSPYKGKFYKTQQIPVAWVHAKVKLVIGAGAYVSPEILDQEIKEIEKATGQNLKDRLFIDQRCGAHLLKHHQMEAGMHERMGSTGEGCSAALKDKIDRKFDYQMFRDTDYAKKNDGKHFQIVDTVAMLNDAYDRGKKILLEGTQGTMLDLHLSHYPYCTSRQTIAASWLAEAGLSPTMNIEVVQVNRTFPIRVAGNSGPFVNETSWVELAREINKKRLVFGLKPLVSPTAIDEFEDTQKVTQIDWKLPVGDPQFWSPETRVKYSTELSRIHNEVLKRLPDATIKELKKFFEITTVTKKLRRVARLDLAELDYAISLNRPTYIVLNFLNYQFPSLYELKPNQSWKISPEAKKIREYIKDLELATDVEIRYINVSPFNIQKVK
jgi:adenylosuccinate synthase